MSFRSPVLLFLLIAVAVLALLYAATQLRRRRYIVIFPNVDLVAAAAPRNALWRRHATAAVFLLMLAAMVVAFADPVHETDVERDNAAVVVALDVSRSMEADDVKPTRLVAARRAASGFVAALPADTRVGVVIFSNVASIPVLPTTSHEDAIRAIDRAKPGNGTAIGEALLQSLVALRQRPHDSADVVAPVEGPIRGASIVLLSDGETTSGRSSAVGAAAAHDAKVRVSTIAFGTPDGRVRSEGQEFLVPVVASEMREIADLTKGKFFRATSAIELADVYQDVGGDVAYQRATSDLSAWFLLGALAVGLFALAGSVVWSGRIP